jgi:ubiquinone biosynthesis protein
MADLSQVVRESRSFINALPRQLNFLLRKINSPSHSFRLEVPDIQDLKKSMEVSFNLLFLGVIIAALVMSSSYIFVHPTDSHIWGMPTISFVGYSLAVILGLAAFINYIKKS